MTDERIISSIKTRPPFALLDILVACLVTLLCFMPLIFNGTASAQAKTLLVIVDGQTTEYDLSQNAEITLDGLTVVVNDGKVWVKDAKCPDKVCEHTQKIEDAGESIVCLPQGVIVRITGESEFDASTGER